MNSAAETVDYPRLLPLKDRGHQHLQIRKDSGNTVDISPLPARITSEFAPFLVSVNSSRSSRTSPCPAASVSPCLRPEIASTREKGNAARSSDPAQDRPQGTENEARMKSVPQTSQSQSRWAQKKSEDVKTARIGLGRLRGRKSRARHVTDKEKAAAKINRRARKHARREARAVKAAEVKEKREALAAEVDRAQRLWLAARRRRAGVPYMPVVVHSRAAPYEPAGTGSKSAPDERRLPRQDLSEETDGEGWPEADENVVPHRPAIPCNPAILYKPPGSGAKSAPGQRLVIVPRALDLSEETDDEGRDGTEETVLPSKHVVPAILYKPPGSGAKSAPGQRLVIVPQRLPRHDLSDETDQDDWSDVDETMSSVTSENLEREQSRMLQHELAGEETMQEGLSWRNGHEPMRTVPEQDRGYDEIQYERAEDSYGLGNESGLDSGEETVEEDWSNINPRTLLTARISTSFG